MVTFLTVLHIFVILLLIVAVLLQSGKGAEISASFGGSSQTVFGSSGGANFFTRLTFGLAGIFMVTSIALTILKNENRRSVFDDAPASSAAPATAPSTTPGAAPTAPTTSSTVPATAEQPAATPPANVKK